MVKKKYKISNGFIVSTIFLVVISVMTWLFWSDVKVFILGSEYRAIVRPEIEATLNRSLKDRVLLRLEDLRQYGQWPITSVMSNPSRGNPFEPKN